MLNSARLFSLNLLISIYLCTFFLPQLIDCTLTTIINFEYYTSLSNYSNQTEDIRTDGTVSTSGSQSIINYGPAFVLIDQYGKYDACEPPINSANYSQGIAIIPRGGNCTFSVKIARAKQCGAAGRFELPRRFSY